MFEICLNDESLEKDLFLYIYLVFRILVLTISLVSTMRLHVLGLVLQSTTRLTNGESTIFVKFCFISIADNLTV